MRVFRSGRFLRKDASPERHVQAGDRHNRERNWPAAAQEYRAAVALDPTLAHIWVQLGHACKENGDLAEAEAAYRQAARLLPDDIEPWLLLGHLLALSGKPQASIDAFTEAQRLSADPDLAADALSAQRTQLANPARPWTAPDWLTDEIHSYWRAQGFSDPALGLFDPWAYWQLNRDVRLQVATIRAIDLVRHFCEEGIERGLPFSLVEAFDPDFYRAFQLDNMPFSTTNAYRHWLGTGIANHVPPNARRWIQSLLGDDVTTLAGLDPLLSCAFADPDAARHTQRTVIEGFIADVVLDARRPIIPNQSNAPVLHAVARRAERSRDKKLRSGARALRERIHLHVPDFRDNTRALAEATIARGLDGASRSLLQSLIAGPDEPARTFSALAQVVERLGLRDTALATIRSGCDTWPGNVALRRTAEQQADRWFHQIWDEALAMARLGRIPDGQAHIAEFLDQLPRARADERRRTNRGRSIAIVGMMNLPQCNLYRIDPRREQLERQGYDVRVFDALTDVEAFRAAVAAFDAVIFYRVPAYPALVRAIDDAHAVGAVTIYEIDDPIFATDLYPEPFETYAGSISQETYYGLALGAPLFAKAMALCDHAIASTKPLAELMRPHVSGRMFVLPNGLGNAHEIAMRRHGKARSKPPGAPVTIFYGSNTNANRAEISQILEPALVQIIRQHGANVRLCIIGTLAEDSVLRDLDANVLLLPVIKDVQAYWALLASADINLAVLAPSAITHTKSGIKWLEAAMFGIPSILSDTQGYHDVARDETTALFATTSSDWVKALNRLITDEGLRRKIGEAAYRDAISIHGPERLSRLCHDILTEVEPTPDTRPRILVVNVFYPPQAIGGATRVVHDTVVDLSRAENPKYHFEIFTSLEGGTPHVPEIHVRDGVAVTAVGPLDVEDKDAIADDPLMVEQFETVVDRVRPTLVHFHCIQRLTVGIVDALRARDIPYCITVHDAWWISDYQFAIDKLGHERLYNYANPLETLARCGSAAFERMEHLRSALFGARAIIAVSRSFGELYQRCGIPNVRVIENGITPLIPAARAHRPDGAIRLGFIGGLSRHKGWDLIQIALRQGNFSNLELLAIDHAMAAGEERADTFGTTPVVFRGKTAQADITTLYADIDVLLAPSIWPESFGLVTREAALCGCWVIASRLGAIGDAIEHGVNGFHVDVSTADGLRDRLATIDANPALFRQRPPPLSEVRTAQDQARDVALLYNELLSQMEIIPA
ncbi:glycosyltransferase [Tanticharoenia sakaeratensis]|uniref:Group 1 glycosyl transferase n=1 Tax=Tanticharoenia sakaeratensis NBRC 103193 TaxID=1231623 RepID=A0A0D6MMB1_9PROT|nr:glycosyltransferase [Tanticharoenia sakaeratensis]GAN54797.1 group 1 glycosyl transferase [Tanticharoenia sakaeratensis NBRC 103193]GBQ21529.1 glycosyltransferase [Tanticharoenia sakaeratensis NBRC 103193]